MSLSVHTPVGLQLPEALLGPLLEAAAEIVADRRKAFRAARRPRVGAALRPGRETPLWNALAAEVRPHLKAHGAQVNLGRLLGLPRQQVNAFFTRRTRMPDAERTLQLIAWLIAVRQRRPPA